MKGYGIITALAALIIIIEAAYIYAVIKKSKAIKIKEMLHNSILDVLEPKENLERNLANFLLVIASVIKAPSYALYLIDENNSNYAFKAVRHMTSEDTQIAPSYTGLLPYKKETFLMPTSLPLSSITEITTIKEEGEVSFVFVPIKGGKAIILIGPVSKISKVSINKLNFIGEKMEKILESLLEAEDLKRRLKTTTSPERALKSISTSFSDFNAMIKMILSISIKTISASAGLFISEEEGSLSVEASQGFDTETEALIFKDSKTLTLIKGFIGDEALISINKKDKSFFQIPPYFIASEVELIMLLNIITESSRSIAVFFYKNISNLKDYQVTALQIMCKRIGEIVINHNKFKQLSTSYIDELKILARKLDNLKPTTIGYSELMYRYALVICKELKLSTKDTMEITLAAYLSNIGIAGIPNNILFKAGRYTEIEYETMKMHSEAGAAMIEATLGNHNIASIIRHHHERIDGYGYPVGLSGEEIPIGSRILSVVQIFLAKISSREYREALSFPKALEQLKNASGTQLDERIVNILIDWFAVKQQENRKRNSSLGRCFEMRCVPNSICINCPVYKGTNKNCWDTQGNHCAYHGNKCNTCFVKTEYLHRLGKNNE